MEVIADTTDVRLDKYLACIYPQCSRKKISVLISNGNILVNYKKAKKSRIIKKGDKIYFHVLPTKKVIPNKNVPINIIYDDESVLIINKHPGIPCNVISEGDNNTIVNAIAYYYPEILKVGGDIYNSGLVNRIDIKTSGLIIIARNNDSYIKIRNQFKERKVLKEYIALVYGKYKGPKKIVNYIAHHKKNKKKMVVVKNCRKYTKKIYKGITELEKLYYVSGYTILNIKIHTGIMHQIRVTLADLGYPVIGDDIYREKEGETDLNINNRYELYAVKVGFMHPVNNKWFEIGIKEKVIDSLRARLKKESI